jgi:ATP-dependent RNA helicase DDX18/HAS1
MFMHLADLQAVGRAFGFSSPPRVDLAFPAPGDKRNVKKNRAKNQRMGSGHSFSASNFHGKREAGDTRQFMH